MSSIEDDEFDCDAEALFQEVLVPLAATGGEKSGFPVLPDPDAGSYYEKPVRVSMRGADFDLPGAGAVDGFVTGMCEYWRSQGRDDLAALEDRLRSLAAGVARKDALEDGDVSPFIYPMF